MTKICIYFIIFLWCGLLWASPTMATFENSRTSNNELLLISADTLSIKKSDCTVIKNGPGSQRVKYALSFNQKYNTTSNKTTGTLQGTGWRSIFVMKV